MLLKLTSIIFLAALLIGCSDLDDIDSPRKNINKMDKFIFAEGRWKALSGTNAKIISRINFTSITCDRSKNTCEEIISLVHDPKEDKMFKNYILLNHKFTYQITDWTNDTIKAKFEAPVGDAEITISLRDNFAEKSWRETKARSSENSDPNIYGKWVLE